MRNMKNKRGKLITVLFVAAMSVSLFTGCSDDATITGLDEGALPELASDTRAVTDELIESDSISKETHKEWVVETVFLYFAEWQSNSGNIRVY